MHMFGLAIDVNYTHNPFIGASANDVLERAGQLVHGGADPKKKTAWSSNMSYKGLSELNKTLTDYFALARNRAGLEAKLKTATGPWADLRNDPAKAQQAIEDDLSAKPVKGDKSKHIAGSRGGLAWRWARGNKIDVIRATGFMNVKEELVRGLKMNWGAAYGDNMHFDLRTDGADGQKIFGAIAAYMKKLKQDADAP
jgi:hypothetical protein